jgi:parvulin-like peptidyl-prolyl isomerase
MGEKYIVIRLDKIEPSPVRIIPATEKERIRKMLIEDRKEKIISDWIADLRKKASVKILIKNKI